MLYLYYILYYIYIIISILYLSIYLYIYIYILYIYIYIDIMNSEYGEWMSVKSQFSQLVSMVSAVMKGNCSICSHLINRKKQQRYKCYFG